MRQSTVRALFAISAVILLSMQILPCASQPAESSRDPNGDDQPGELSVPAREQRKYLHNADWGTILGRYRRAHFDALSGMSMGKRPHFDSLSGMSMGKRAHFDALSGMSMGKRAHFDALSGMSMGRRR